MGHAPGRARQPETSPTLGDAAVGISVPSQWEPQVTYKPDFGPTRADFTKAFTDKVQDRARLSRGRRIHGRTDPAARHRAGGSIDQAKVAAALNKMDVTTMFGRTKFSTDPKEHGLQIGHEMVLAQWQKKDGKLVKEVIWPNDGQDRRHHLLTDVSGHGLRDRGAGRVPACPSPRPRNMIGILASVIDGVLVGAVYGLAAMGLTLIWGVMHVINLAHGAMIVLGMFALYFLAHVARSAGLWRGADRRSSSASCSVSRCTGSRCIASSAGPS